MGIKDRLLEFIKHEGLNNKQFEEKCGLGNGFVSKIGTTIRIEKIESISKTFPKLSTDWLQHEKGSMLNSDNFFAEDTVLNEEAPSSDYRLVPLINIDCVGGLANGNESMDEQEYVIGMIPFNGALEGDKCLQVTGQSMEPACPPGSVVLIREVERWNEYFGFGNIFVVLLEDGRRVLKQITKSDEDPKKYVKCVSFNKEYPEEDLPKSMIAGVWKVIKVLNNRGW